MVKVLSLYRAAFEEHDMKKNIWLFGLLLAMILLVIPSCDLLNTISKVIPDFSFSEPNLIFGSYELPSTYEGHYLYQLDLSLEGGYFCRGSDYSSVSGSYEIEYDHLELLRSSGTLVLSDGLDGKEKSKMKFSFEADVDEGPCCLTLDGRRFLFLGR